MTYLSTASSGGQLEVLYIEGATGVIVNITGGVDLTMGEVQHAVGLIYEVVDEKANIIFGADIRDDLEEEVQVTIIATGFDKGFETFREEAPKKEPQPARPLFSDHDRLDRIFGAEKKEEQMRPSQPKAEPQQRGYGEGDNAYSPRMQPKDDSDIPPFLRKLRK